MERIKDSFPDTNIDIGISAVLTFLEGNDFQALFEHPLWKEIEEKGLLLSFKM